MGMILEKAKTCFDDKGLSYEMVGENRMAIRCPGSGNVDHVNLSASFRIENGISIRYRFPMAVSSEQEGQVYELCSSLNCDYRWVKFFVGFGNHIYVATDGLFAADIAGEGAYRLVSVAASVVDEAYPKVRSVLEGTDPPVSGAPCQEDEQNPQDGGKKGVMS